MKLMMDGLGLFKKTNQELTKISGWKFDWWYMEDNDIISQFAYNNYEYHLRKQEMEDLLSDCNASHNIMDAFVQIITRAMKMQQSQKKLRNFDDKWYLLSPEYNGEICPILYEDNSDSILSIYHTLLEKSDDDKQEFIDKCKEWFLETRNKKFFDVNESDELPNQIMIPICVKGITWILCLVMIKRKKIFVVDSDIIEGSDDASKEYFFEKLKVVNWVAKWLMLYKRFYDSQQYDLRHPFEPDEMFLEDEGNHQCGIFEIKFMNKNFVAQQEEENDSWVHCIRNIISKLSNQNIPKEFPKSTKSKLKNNVFSMLQKIGIGGQDIDIFHPPE